MRLRRSSRAKLCVLVLTGGTLFVVLQNCAIFAYQTYNYALNWTWFLTCQKDTLFSGAGLLLDCEGASSSTSGTSTSGLSSLLGGGTSTTGTSTSDLLGGLDPNSLAGLL